MRLHAVKGKEAGLMIIGKADELRSLGARLQSAVDGDHEIHVAGYPPTVLTVDAESPYKDYVDFGVSFHVELEPLSEGLTTKGSYGPTTLFFSTVSILTIIGAISAARFVFNAVF